MNKKLSVSTLYQSSIKSYPQLSYSKIVQTFNWTCKEFLSQSVFVVFQDFVAKKNFVCDGVDAQFSKLEFLQ